MVPSGSDESVAYSFTEPSASFTTVEPSVAAGTGGLFTVTVTVSVRVKGVSESVRISVALNWNWASRWPSYVISPMSNEGVRVSLFSNVIPPIVFQGSSVEFV